MAVRIIGVDCAVQAKNVGLARGSYSNGRTQIDQALIGADEISIAATILDWVAGARRTLIALDAPLGWPAALAEELHTHQAGDALKIAPNHLFRRATDHFIKQAIGKQPLDVGADRIARTAHAALDLLAEIQTTIGQAVPLAWEPGIGKGISAVEVYPAATLIVHGIHAPGYKRKENQAVRKKLLGELGELVDLPAEISLLEDRHDVLDAALCVLAGADFLSGQVYYPPDILLARKEGWIWVRTAA